MFFMLLKMHPHESERMFLFFFAELQYITIQNFGLGYVQICGHTLYLFLTVRKICYGTRLRVQESLGLLDLISGSEFLVLKL